jgi:membrane-associated phospholipid phosphatase
LSPISGHTAIAVLAAAELARLGKKWLAAGVILVAFEIVTVVVLRAHYTMDVFAGAVTALLASRLAQLVCARFNRD